MAVILTAAAVVLLAIVVIRLIGQIYELEKRIKILEKLWDGSEHRCPECKFRKDCPAAFTGVIYPCEHFEEVSNEEDRS